MFSITGYFRAGSKLVGRTMTPQMSVSRRALRDEHLRRLPAGFHELGDVGFLERRDEFAVGGPAQLGHRRKIDARIGVGIESLASADSTTE